MRYSNVPRPRERLSSKPKPHSLLRYVQAARVGKKSGFSAASFGPSHSPWVEANKASTCSLSSLYRFIFLLKTASSLLSKASWDHPLADRSLGAPSFDLVRLPQALEDVATAANIEVKLDVHYAER